MVQIYRAGSKSGDHASTGGGHLTAAHFIGALTLEKGATEFSLTIKETETTLAFYVNGTLVGEQTLTDGKCMIGNTEFDYTTAKIGLVPCYNNPSTSHDFWLGSQALADGDSVSFKLDYGKAFME